MRLQSAHKLPSSGKLLYREDGWVILRPCQDLGRYYKWWLARARYLKLNNPFHDYHITVVAGKYEDARLHEAWKKHDKAVIPFFYSPEIEDDQTTFWLCVESPELEEIRLELGLYPFPKWPFHLSIGNLKGV